MWIFADTGKVRVSGWRGAKVVSIILTPGELTGTAHPIAYASSPGFIALVGITIRSCAIDAPVMCSLAPRITTPSLRRSTTRVYASGSSCLPGGRRAIALRVRDAFDDAHVFALRGLHVVRMRSAYSGSASAIRVAAVVSVMIDW